MNKLFFIISLFFISLQTVAQPVMLSQDRKKRSAFPQTVAQFNFSWTANSVADWINVVGDPYSAVLTGTDSRSGSAIGVSTIATGATYWNWNGSAAAGFVPNSTANGDFPAAVGSGYFFHMSTSSPIGGNMKLNGLQPLATYTVQVWSIRPTVTDNRQTAFAIYDNSTSYTAIINSAPSTNNTTTVSGVSYNQVINGGTVITVPGLIANTSGELAMRIWANPSYTYGYINAVRVIRTA